MVSHMACVLLMISYGYVRSSNLVFFFLLFKSCSEVTSKVVSLGKPGLGHKQTNKQTNKHDIRRQILNVKCSVD